MMFIRRLVSVGIVAVLMTAMSGCWVTKSEYGRMKDWLYRNQAPGDSSHYASVYAWMERVTGVVCTLEWLDQTHQNKVKEKLCPNGDPNDPFDPKGDPPPPPDWPEEQ